MSEHYTHFSKQGEYVCSKCGNNLFTSDAKFKSGTAWPSFRKTMPDAVIKKPDYSHSMVRTEVLCAKCGQHLGHVFDDGKACGDKHSEAGKRYCILSDTLQFKEENCNKPKTSKN